MLSKSKNGEHVVQVSKQLSLRLCCDSLPRHGHTGCLQKGLTLSHEDLELSGEGTGLGVPVVRCMDRDYFSGSSTIRALREGDGATLLKRFIFDVVLEKNFKGIKSRNKMMRNMVRRLEELYQTHGTWTWIKLKKSILENLGVQTNFVKVEPVGSVSVVYGISDRRIDVKADFGSFRKEKELEKIFLLNEQASSCFRRYEDSDGRVLFDDEVRPWERVGAEWASFYGSAGDVGFRLWNVRDAALYRGREYLKDMFDWAGLSYEVDPGRKNFEYVIEILGAWND